MIECGKLLRRRITSTDRLKPMSGAIDMYKKLSARYDCEILSAIPKPHRGIENAGEDKKNWVREC